MVNNLSTSIPAGDSVPIDSHGYSREDMVRIEREYITSEEAFFRSHVTLDQIIIQDDVMLDSLPPPPEDGLRTTIRKICNSFRNFLHSPFRR
jgi:hypothetical protein